MVILLIGAVLILYCIFFLSLFFSEKTDIVEQLFLSKGFVILVPCIVGT